MMRESWLPARPDCATRARAIVREACIEQGLDDHALGDLMLATSEAFSNAIVHGAACSDGDEGILLRVLPWDHGLWVEVCDCGRFEDAPPPPGPDEPHGRGIPLITAVVDRVDLITEGAFTRVCFGKRRRSLAGAFAGAPRREGLGR